MPMRPALKSTLLCAVLSLSAAFGQSLSLNQVARQYRIEASPVAANPATLQATENFHLWIDVTNQITDPVSLILKYPHVSSRYYRLIPAPPEAPAIRIVALGDSLISDDMGWGGGIYGYLKPNATYLSYAWPGDGSTVAITHRLATLNLIKPQFVFFEFGATDMALEVSPEQFEANLRTIVTGIREFNGVPLLVTVHCHRQFDAKGNFIPWDFPYNYITRKVAAEMNAPLIDLDKILGDLYRKLGPGGSEFMRFVDPRFPNDTIHLSPLGAVWIAQLVLKTLPASAGPYLSEVLLDPPPSP